VNNKIIPAVYTIGYSPHSLDNFLCILQKYAVTVLADVRSALYSSYRREFNYRNLKKILPEQGIQYVFLGRELGARYEDVSVYYLAGSDRVNPLIQHRKSLDCDCFSALERLFCSKISPL